jgi:hypothetical protein
VGGIGEFFEDAGKYIADHGDQIADVAEVVVPIIAPYAAPVVAAEHALRKGIELSQAQAKAATTGATAVGQAVAQHVADQAAEAGGRPAETGGRRVAKISPAYAASSEVEPGPALAYTTRDSIDLGTSKPKRNDGVLIIAAIGLGLLLLSEL